MRAPPLWLTVASSLPVLAVLAWLVYLLVLMVAFAVAS